MRSPLYLIGTAFARARQIMTLLLSPETRTRIRVAAKRYNSSAFRVVIRLIGLFGRERFMPEEALTIGLADPRRPLDDHRQFISFERLHGLQVAINTPDRAMCRDKVLYNSYCRHYGLPVPVLLGVLSRFGSRSETGKALNTPADFEAFVRHDLPPRFIAKPRGGNMGRGVYAMGTELDTPSDTEVGALARALADLARAREDYILQARVYSHPDIAELTGSTSISSVRIATLVLGGEPPLVLGAYWRVIAGDRINDNIDDPETGKYSGNILARVNLEDGRIIDAAVPAPDGVGLDPVEAHPVTGERFAGFALPMWADALDLVRRAALCFLPLRTIGWDVAFTPDGPMLIEANELYHFGLWGEDTQKLRRALEAEKARLSSVRGAV